MSTVDLHKIALEYHTRGWNVLPVDGKRPNVSGWKKWQTMKQDVGEINRLESYWNTATGIAVVCGSVSRNLVVIDLDGQFAVDLFYNQFPQLTKTHTVKTGNGLHLYFYQHHKFITDGKANHKIVVGGGEISVRVQNCYVVAPPSLHPSGKRYEAEASWNIKRTATLGRVLMWMKQYKTQEQDEVTKYSTLDQPKRSMERLFEATEGKKTNVDPGKTWGQTALVNELQAVSTAGKGNRNDQLYKSALKLGSIIAGGYLTRSQVQSSLMTGADLCGLVQEDGKAQCEKTINGGINKGMESPRHPSNDSAPTSQNGKKPDLNKTPEDKEADDNHPLAYKPDSDQLAQYVYSQMQSNYAYFNDSWHIWYQDVWLARKNINRGIRDVLRTIRNRGVKNDSATVGQVNFFLKTEMEMMDESCVDNYPDYVNCANGMFNLRTMKLEPLTPQFLITQKAEWTYDPNATCPTFLSWLESMLTYPDGTPDPLMIYLVQEAFGYSLTTDTRYRMSFWLKGPKHSGKSTLLEVLGELLSIYHCVLDLNQLDKNRYLLALTYRKRVATCAETEKGLKINDGQYKQLVDNASKVVADVKHKEPITFKPTAKIWWAMNNFPYINDNTGAVHSRVTVIPYHRSISIEERDLDLLDKIRMELPGVFNWALQALVRLNQQKRFTVSPQSDELKRDLEVKDSVYLQFLDDEQWCQPGEVTLSRHLNAAFKSWCSIQGIRNNGGSDKRRKQEWVDAGLEYNYTSKIAKYYGVELTEHAMKQATLFQS